MGLVMNQNIEFFKAVEDRNYLLAEKLLKNGANPYSYNNVIVEILIKETCQKNNEKALLLIKYVFNNFKLENFSFFTVFCDEIHGAEIYRSTTTFNLLSCLIVRLDNFLREKDIITQQLMNAVKYDVEAPNLQNLSISELILKEENLFLLLKDNIEVENEIKSLVKKSNCLKKLSIYYALDNF
jgi:hypothetical protein